MSITLDMSVPQSDKGSTSRVEPTERQPSKFAPQKVKTLRLDSPTTIQACKELGILVEDLKPKALEDFKDSTLEDSVIQLRFNHHMKRHNQFLIDVLARKKQLNRIRIRNEKHQQKLEAESNGVRSLAVLKTAPNMNSSNSPNGGGRGHNASVANALLPSPMLHNYNRTMAYLRTSHDTADTKDIRDILAYEASTYGDDPTERFDTALAQEVSKFNKIKRQKQKEAKDAFEEEMKRVKTVEDLRAKEKRMNDREKKLAIEKKKEDEERRRRAEDKLDKIREAEKNYRTHKQEEKDKIKKKLESTRKKLAEEAEEKHKQLTEQEERLEQKRKIAEERREKIKQDEQARCDQLKLEIEMKLNQSEQKYHFTLNDKTTRVKFQMSRVEESVKKIRDKQEMETEEHVQKLVEKLVKKEESAKAFQKQQVLQLKQRERQLADKSSRFFDHKSDLNQQYKDRMNEINEKFQKVQENLEAKREQDDKDMRLRQEENRLKILDKQDNYNRQQRQIAYERQKVLDRAKHNQEKILALKHQKEVLQQAKVEVSIQSKIEKERIEQSVQQLTKLTNEAISSKNLTDQQKRILKEILTPGDFQKILDEEKKREDEKKEAEEARKLGIPVPPAVKAR